MNFLFVKQSLTQTFVFMKSIKFPFFLFSLIACNTLQAQLFTKPNKALNDAIQQVINDIPNHFQNLQGDLIQKDNQSSTYESKIKIPGADNTTVTAYTSLKDKSKSMGAVVFETESFAEAKKKYNEIINQIKIENLKLPGETNSFKWKLNYDKPDESKNFSSSIFRTGSDKAAFKNIKLEVSLTAQVTSYSISIFVYEKKEDDAIAGEALNDY